MKSRTPVSKFSVLLGGMLSAVVLSASAFAQHSGGGGGGGHAGGGGHFGGAAGGHAVAGGRPGAYGGYGYRGGGYGYRGGYGGWHGGYYGGWRGGGWGCCGWGWGWPWGLGVGLYFATLPLYYQTYYWNGVPYYYADNTYYIYDPNARQYETVAPPDGLAAQNGGSAGGPPAGTDLIAYPKNGQSSDQQAKDKFECHEWAAGQTGYDPTTGSAAPANKRTDYMRAQAACLEGRGYSVQ
jgi:hypothetical protein